MAARWVASVSLVAGGLLLGAAAMAQKQEEGQTAAVEQVAAATPDFAPREDKGAQDRAEFRTLDENVQGLKKQVLDLNRDLFVLEEELLFPSNTQTAVFVAMDVGEFFGLDSVELKIDNKAVANYLYTEREASALIKGGVQRLYVGNLKAGEHELVAVFVGGGPHARDYRRATSVKFEKGIGPKYIELTISDRATKQQPEFVVKEWE